MVNHLWQSTLFAALVALAALALRRNQAKIRYAWWMAASKKFLVPFSLLVSLGSQVEMPKTTPIVTALAVEQTTATFAPTPVSRTAARPDRGRQRAVDLHGPAGATAGFRYRKDRETFGELTCFT